MLRKMPATFAFLVYLATHAAVEISPLGSPLSWRAAPMPVSSLAPCLVSWPSRNPQPPPVTSTSLPPIR